MKSVKLLFLAGILVSSLGQIWLKSDCCLEILVILSIVSLPSRRSVKTMYFVQRQRFATILAQTKKEMCRTFIQYAIYRVFFFSCSPGHISMLNLDIEEHLVEQGRNVVQNAHITILNKSWWNDYLYLYTNTSFVNVV